MLKEIRNYIPPDPTLWQGRTDSLPGERFFQKINFIDLSKQALTTPGHTILGFACDEGVRRNLGKIGAREGPDALRVQLAKLACHTNEPFIDIGNIYCKDNDLETAQEQFAKLVAYSHHCGNNTVAFGGSHDMAWSHFQGLIEHYPKLGVINIDAHFDIRLLKNNQGSSGTPFLQIHDYCLENQHSFNYCCLGIQPTANTQSLFDRANEWKISYMTAEELHNESLAQQTAFLDEFMLDNDYLYLTICLDVFDECFAPGVSAPQAMGINPWRALPLLKYIKQSGKVVGIDIAELSPPLDERQKTARLGAILLAELFSITNKGN